MELMLNKRLLAALFLGSVMACDGGTDTGDKDDTDTDDTEVSGCTSGIDSTFPDVGATGVFYRTAIQVVFLEDESGGSLTLADGDGNEVAGETTFSADGETAFFTPTDDLAPSTTYTLTISYSCDDATIDFTTSDVGDEVDSADVLNSVYSIDISTGRFVEPPGVGELISGLLAEQDVEILVSPTEYDEGAMEMSMIGALGDGSGAQDPCNETIAFPVAADYSANPFFAIEGENVELSAAGVTLELSTILLSGAFAPEGASVEGVLLDGTVDTRPLGELFDLGDTEDAVCNLVAGFGITCEDCGDGTELCLSLLVDDMSAPGVAGTIEPVDATELQARIDAGTCTAE